MKRYYCDKCGKQINIELDGFAQFKVMWWCKGGMERLKYRPDLIHCDGYEDYMVCAACANDIFNGLEGMEDA